MPIDNHFTPKEEYDSAPVVASSGEWEGEVESVPIGDSRRARAWMVGVRDFQPPEIEWFYVYITSGQATFSSRDSVILDVQEPAVTIFPPGNDHSVELEGHAFVFGAAGPSLSEVDPAGWPKTATVDRIETVLKSLNGGQLRLVVGGKRKDEEDWEDRDWSFDEKGGVPTRQVLVNAADEFELSVANEKTKHAAHAHQKTFEAFASASGINVLWRGEEKESQSSAGPAIVVVSPPFCHDVVPSGTTYVFRVSSEGSSAVDDETPCASLE